MISELRPTLFPPRIGNAVWIQLLKTYQVSEIGTEYDFYSYITLNFLPFRQENPGCAIDGESISRQQSFRDKCCEREVLNLQCFCRFNKKGCEWKGDLRHLRVNSVQLCIHIHRVNKIESRCEFACLQYLSLWKAFCWNLQTLWEWPLIFLAWAYVRYISSSKGAKSPNQECHARKHVAKLSSNCLD